MIFNIKFGKSAEQQRAENAPAKIHKEAPKAEKPASSFNAEQGAIEAALEEGRLSLDVNAMTNDALDIERALTKGDLDPSRITLEAIADIDDPMDVPDPKKRSQRKGQRTYDIDAVALENLSLAVVRSGLNVESLDPEVRGHVKETLENQLSGDPEFEAIQSEIEATIEKINTAETAKAEATEAAKAEANVDDLADNDILKQATEFGFNDLAGLASPDIQDAKDERDSARQELSTTFGMSDAELDRIASGRVKTGLFGRIGGFFSKKAAKKNSLMEQLASRTELLNDFDRLKQEVSKGMSKLEGTSRSESYGKRTSQRMRTRQAESDRAMRNASRQGRL